METGEGAAKCHGPVGGDVPQEAQQEECASDSLLTCFFVVNGGGFFLVEKGVN